MKFLKQKIREREAKARLTHWVWGLSILYILYRIVNYIF